MALTLIYDFATETVINGTNHQDEHQNIANKFNANIRAADIAGNAGIGLAQLAASYQVQQVVLGKHSATWPAATIIDSVPFYYSATEASWTLMDVAWYCTDVGSRDGTFKIDLAYYTAAGVFTVKQNLVAATTITAGANDIGAQGYAANTTAMVAFGAEATTYAIVLSSVAAGTNALTAATDMFTVRLRMKRQIIA